MASPYEKMWSEENLSCADAWYALSNYGPRTETRYGCGISGGLIFVKDFYGELFLTTEEVNRCADKACAFFSVASNLKKFLEDVEEAEASIKKQIKHLIAAPLEAAPFEIIGERMDAFGQALSRLFICYSMMETQRMKKLEDVANDELKRKKLPYELAQIVVGQETIELTPLGEEFFGQSLYELVKSDEAVIQPHFIQENIFKQVRRESAIPEVNLMALPLSEEERHIFFALRSLAIARLRLRHTWMLAMYYAESFLAELHRRLSISKEYLRLYEPQDMEALLKTQARAPEHFLLERKQGYLVELKDGVIKSLQGEPALKYLRTCTAPASASRSLKGTVTCTGHHIGRAVILSYRHPEEHPDKILRMSPGDVLVSEMTRPNIMSAVQKAGAIVTDEGGITCHAAIISREFNVPCVVGTRYATSSFHDGDLLEVDAVNGVVRHYQS